VTHNSKNTQNIATLYVTHVGRLGLILLDSFAAEAVLPSVFVRPAAPATVTYSHRRCRILRLSTRCPRSTDHWSVDPEWSSWSSEQRSGIYSAYWSCSELQCVDFRLHSDVTVIRNVRSKLFITARLYKQCAQCLSFIPWRQITHSSCER